MKRATLDKLISYSGLVFAVVLIISAGALYFTHDFIHGEVNKQLSEQKIFFPKSGTEAINGLPAADKAAVEKYAGQQLLTGAQAKTYADHFINAHLDKIGGGKSYAELSSAAQANPSDTALAGKVQTVFRGETLRGLLLNAYAFDTMAVVARFAAVSAVIAAGVMLLLVMLGFNHAFETARAERKAARSKKRR